MDRHSRKQHLNHAGQEVKKAFGRFWILGMLLSFLCMSLFQPAQAQSSDRTVITSLEISQFPGISFYMDAYDGRGNFLSDLQATQVQVLEDSRARVVSELTKIQPGVQIVIAMNAAPVLSNRVGDQTYYQIIQRVLQSWAQGQAGSPQDDFSLVGNTGLQVAHQTNPANWSKAINDYQPDLLKAQPNLASLTQALDLVTDPTPRPQMKRAILYITPILTLSNPSSLSNLADRAAQLGARVFVWLVAQAGTSNAQNLEPLKQLVTRTGGQLFSFSGSENLPDLETYLKPLRSIYRISYSSGINQSGNHRLAVQVEREGFKAVSSELSFTVSVEAPNPIFLTPPTQITRSQVRNSVGAAVYLSPESLQIQILIEFPDGHIRSLKSTRLFVDGKLAAENKQPPFDRFDWNLTGITTSGRVALRIETEDILGLTRASIELPVEIRVEASQENQLNSLLNRSRLMIGGAVVAAAVVVILVLVLSGRKKPFRSNSRRPKDPATQPVRIHQEKRQTALSEDSTAPTLPMKIPSDQQAAAYLILLSETGHPIPGSAIPIGQAEITMGSDASQAMIVFDSPSIESLHARMVQTAGGAFILADCGSVAGTWVNYAPVTIHGVHLEHGDLIHLGRVALRFELSRPPLIRQPKVTPYEETQ